MYIVLSCSVHTQGWTAKVIDMYLMRKEAAAVAILRDHPPLSESEGSNCLENTRLNILSAKYGKFVQ